jgi:ATP-dependent helicase/DNAse subunit B
MPLLEKNEVELMELEHKLKTSIHSFNLKGSLDRIEKRNGRIYIIDYKTSSNDHYLKINYNKLDPADRNNWSDSIGSLQLPFYLTLFTTKTGETVDSINGVFLTLGRMAIDEKIELPLFQSKEEALNYFPILQDIIFKLLHEIVNPDIPFEPALKRHKTCSFCAFQHICGI